MTKNIEKTTKAFKTYQKLLGASCLALYLAGCGGGSSADSRGGGSAESPIEPIEMKADSNGGFQIISKVNSVTIQGVKLNKGDCVVNFVRVEEKSKKGVLDQTHLISMQDLKDAERVSMGSDYGAIVDKISQLKQKGLMMEPQTLEFGEKIEGFSKGCNIREIETQIARTLRVKFKQ